MGVRSLPAFVKQEPVRYKTSIFDLRHMSHTIGQNTEDNQKLNADRASSVIENNSDSDASLLSDADYEFLFNQLLEGVAHGWHDLRIVRFFDLLGDRGKAKNWVAWLERSHPRMITLPIESKRQLGTLMVRLGELTHANSKIGKIGTVSNRIGRELLYGNTENIVWEYVGPDLVLDSLDELESESVAERLPENFAELGATSVEDEPDLIATPHAAAKEPEDYSPAEAASKLPLDSEEAFLLDLDALEDFPEHLPADDLEAIDSAAEDMSASVGDEAETDNELPSDSEEVFLLDLDALEDVPESLPADDLEIQDSTAEDNLAVARQNDEKAENLAADRTFDDEFEFELDPSTSSLEGENLIPNVSELETPANPEAIFDPDRELLDIVESPQNLSSNPDSATKYDSKEPSQSLDADRVINLIQEDEKLAQEIAEKLNISSDRTSNSIANSPPNSPSDSVNLDRSSIELIEGWFNLGLKQVSGGEFDKAIASWEKALQIDPNLSEAWHNRGSALGRLGKYSEAVESFQKALTINPNNYQAWNDRAHALYQLKNWAAAADSWSNAIKITPANHLFWYNRGCALEQLESWAESISSYERSLEIKPDFQPARSRYTNLIADNSR